MPLFALSQYYIVEDDSIKGKEYKVYDFPDKEAYFPGGAAAMQKIMLENLIYPKDMNFYDEYGKIDVSFIVDEEGVIRNIKVQRGGWKELNSIVAGVITKMPNWVPAEVGGKSVASPIRLPIHIHLN